jgi:hypothetical protein
MPRTAAGRFARMGATESKARRMTGSAGGAPGVPAPRGRPQRALPRSLATRAYHDVQSNEGHAAATERLRQNVDLAERVMHSAQLRSGREEAATMAKDAVTADDLDREEIEQLHAATLRASDSCFELKKLCVTVLVPAATLVAVFTDKRLDSAVFGAGLMIIVGFWGADSVGYYYQRKLRALMSQYRARRAARCPEPYSVTPIAAVSPFRALFNESMVLYLILALLVAFGWALFLSGGID